MACSIKTHTKQPNIIAQLAAAYIMQWLCIIFISNHQPFISTVAASKTVKVKECTFILFYSKTETASSDPRPYAACMIRGVPTKSGFVE